MNATVIQIVESIFNNPLNFLKLDTAQVHENITIIPIIVQNDKYIDFMSINKAEDLGAVKIIETDSVNEFEVINQSNKQVLIPFGVTVHGGKQDRTVWEPILLPGGMKQNISQQTTITSSTADFHEDQTSETLRYNIPAKCIEQSRWTFRNNEGFKTSHIRLHPNVAYEAMSSGSQYDVWDEIQSHRAEMDYSTEIAPTESYLKMTKTSQKEINDISENFENIPDQCGIAVFINGEFIGIEFYANHKAWNEMSSDIIQAFSIEALRTKEKYNKEKIEDYNRAFIDAMQNITFDISSRNGIGLGHIVELNSGEHKWRGITLINDATPIQFYLVSKRGGSKRLAPRPDLFRSQSNRRF
ncbi:MAG: hypothetical protein EU541_05100 [Promethearchaeota archaeon]|nr:MAG: hypothetical protein EU541_05100 [Candidatus Lokiarchaeota archaeon]